MSKILIIEDDPYVRRFYERLFSLEKYNIDMSGNGEEGIEMAKKSKPSLILLDIMMPSMNGLDVLKKLKSDDETRDITVVMLTNLGDEGTAEKAVEYGADGFIIKSNVEPAELIKTVNGYLKN